MGIQPEQGRLPKPPDHLREQDSAVAVQHRHVRVVAEHPLTVGVQMVTQLDGVDGAEIVFHRLHHFPPTGAGLYEHA